MRALGKQDRAERGRRRRKTPEVKKERNLVSTVSGNAFRFGTKVLL